MVVVVVVDVHTKTRTKTAPESAIYLMTDNH